MHGRVQFGAVLGADGAGVVDAVGADGLRSWLGKEVLINSAFFWGPNRRSPSYDFKILGMLPLPGSLRAPPPCPREPRERAGRPRR